MDELGSRRLQVVATSALIAAVSVAAVSVVTAFRFSQALRGRLEIMAGVSNVSSGILLVLAALLLLKTPANSAAMVRRVIMLVAALMVVGAVYTTFDMVTLHIPSPSATNTSFSASFNQWPDRIAGVLRGLSGGVLAATAVWLLRSDPTNKPIPGTVRPSEAA